MEINKNLTHPKYRSDIDGLRAIAVLSVVIYHVFPNFLKGGFIGVDIFFVISGFLISTIIFENLNNNSFSFATFYSRRIRRIFPALITVLITTAIFGYYVLFSDEFHQLGRHIIGGATFSSNFTLLKESGYFDTSSELKPLLHLWSLGIEEQFYIIFPILCYLIYKFKTKFALTKNSICYLIIFLLAVSFIFNVISINEDTTKTFYYPHTRFWELLFGSFLALLLLNKNSFFDNNEKFNSILSFVGIITLIIGFVYIDATLKFPGYIALIPVIGSFLVIASGNNATINKFLLSNKILVWFGKISFPLYLWHWVLLAYSRIIYAEILPQTWRILLITTAIILSYLTYKFIEYPLRFGKNNKKKVTFLCIIMIIIFGFAWSIKNNKITLKLPQLNTILGYTPNCESQMKGLGVFCPIGNQNIKDNKQRILVYGDSYAYHLTNMLDIKLGKNYAIDIISSSACVVEKNNLDNVKGNSKTEQRCVKTINYLYSYLENLKQSNSKIKAIITSQRWGDYFKDSQSLSRSIVDRINLLKPFTNNVIIVGPTATIDINCENSKLRKLTNLINKQTKNCPQTKHIQQEMFSDTTRKIEKFDNVNYIYPYEILCPNKQCSFFNKNNKVNYIDSNHLSLYGSEPVVNEIAKIIENK